MFLYFCVFFFKQKTAYEMRISDWSSDVCSSDLLVMLAGFRKAGEFREFAQRDVHAEGAAARLEALDPELEVSRQVAGVHQPLVKQLRTDIGDHARRGDVLAADELDPDRLAPVDQHFLDGAFEADLDQIGRAHVRTTVTNAQLVRR